MKFTATVQFTSVNGKTAQRQFAVWENLDGPAYEAALRMGIAAANQVGGHGVHVVNLKQWA